MIWSCFPGTEFGSDGLMGKANCMNQSPCKLGMMFKGHLQEMACMSVTGIVNSLSEQLQNFAALLDFTVVFFIIIKKWPWMLSDAFNRYNLFFGFYASLNEGKLI